jgi:heterodisulfide reductase subunit C
MGVPLNTGPRMSTPVFKVERDLNRCIQCGVCVGQCANKVHHLESDG